VTSSKIKSKVALDFPPKILEPQDGYIRIHSTNPTNSGAGKFVSESLWYKPWECVK